MTNITFQMKSAYDNLIKQKLISRLLTRHAWLLNHDCIFKVIFNLKNLMTRNTGKLKKKEVVNVTWGMVG